MSAQPNMEMVRTLRLVWATLGRTEKEQPGATHQDFVVDLVDVLVPELPAGHPLHQALQSCG